MSVQFQDYYQTLGVSRTASQEDKRANPIKEIRLHRERVRIPMHKRKQPGNRDATDNVARMHRTQHSKQLAKTASPPIEMPAIRVPNRRPRKIRLVLNLRPPQRPLRR